MQYSRRGNVRIRPLLPPLRRRRRRHLLSPHRVYRRVRNPQPAPSRIQTHPPKQRSQMSGNRPTSGDCPVPFNWALLTVVGRQLVPPGMGKPATHSRNIRRRRKLQHERKATIRDPDDPTVGVNAIPLGENNRTEAPETTATQTNSGGNGELTMASLSNKNKRRGFKNAMGKEVPSKIVFSEQVDTNANLNGRAQALSPRLIPPSEKQEKGLLPPNVFVTSVDVEEGIRTRKKPKPAIPSTRRSETPPLNHSAGETDRVAIESKWDSLGLVSSVTQLPTGTIVGWKVSTIQSFA